MQLNKQILNSLSSSGVLTPANSQFDLPEKVIQFGTGVLLRGLPDYFIQKANDKFIFNGRVVVVKSTAQGDTATFEQQNGLFTHVIEGIHEGKNIQQSFVNAAISRVLAATESWEAILALADDINIDIIISNVTEAGFVLDKTDRIDGEAIPTSFPGKLLALLYRRFKVVNGDATKGFIILPTELIPDNGRILLDMVLVLALVHNFESEFIEWIKNANDFCNTLVDRIVPGKPDKERLLSLTNQLGYTDDLLLVSEPYALWAIESSSQNTKDKLSFAIPELGAFVIPSINKYRELKLRLLNGSHTFCCGIALLAGFETVKQAMENKLFSFFLRKLMEEEIIPCLVGSEISETEAFAFSNHVIDRFVNPYLAHKWESIAIGFSAKMKTRNIPIVAKYQTIFNHIPQCMAIGFAAYTLCVEEEATNLENDFSDAVQHYKALIEQDSVMNVLKAMLEKNVVKA